MRSIVISSGHGKKVRGASGYLDEVEEARAVVNRVGDILKTAGAPVKTFHDDTSTTQSQNLSTIVSYHNAQQRDLDVSVHFNAYNATSKPMGVEVLYVTQQQLAADLSASISRAAGLINRGGKKRTDLAFLNATNKPAILIEVCFVDSRADADIYLAKGTEICRTIAEMVGEIDLTPVEPFDPPIPPTDPEAAPTLFTASGRCSWFGGPDDTGVSPSEGLAFLYKVSDAPSLFLPQQPPGTTGLARRLNPSEMYVACRWDYAVTPKAMLADQSKFALVSAGDRQFYARPADWGPNAKTNRVADISPGLMAALGVKTDDAVTVIYPVVPESV